MQLGGEHTARWFILQIPRRDRPGAPVERVFTDLKRWRILTKLCTNPVRATHLLRALLVLDNLEVRR